MMFESQNLAFLMKIYQILIMVATTVSTRPTEIDFD